jgi:hypothetical protein
MNLKMLKAALAGLVLSVSGFASAGLVTLNFDEEIVPNQTLLDGTTYFDSFGIEFNDGVTFTTNTLFTQDTKGIYNSTNLITILWDEEITSLDFNWAIFSGDIIVSLYDVNNALIGTSSFLSPSTNGTGSLSSAGIRKVTWSGNIATMGIDSLTWTTVDVPEPSTLAIFALCIMGLASRRSLLVKKKQ